MGMRGNGLRHGPAMVCGRVVAVCEQETNASPGAPIPPSTKYGPLKLRALRSID